MFRRRRDGEGDDACAGGPEGGGGRLARRAVRGVDDDRQTVEPVREGSGSARHSAARGPGRVSQRAGAPEALLIRRSWRLHLVGELFSPPRRRS